MLIDCDGTGYRFDPTISEPISGRRVFLMNSEGKRIGLGYIWPDWGVVVADLDSGATEIFRVVPDAISPNPGGLFSAVVSKEEDICVLYEAVS